jgi:Fas apoptotic inhibitory molecule (FAIM1)
LLRRDWMFKLVGFEAFRVGKANCMIKVDPVGGFAYGYSLEVNGKSYRKFTEAQSKIMKTWLLHLDGESYRVVLEKDTLDVWANGQRLEAEGVFVDEGSETHFMLGSHEAHICASSSGNRREGIIHNLIVDAQIIPEAPE